MKKNDKRYIVNCKDTIIAPDFFNEILSRGFNLDKKGKEKAEKLYCLCATLPNIPAGVLLDLVEGSRKITINNDKETVTISKEGE